LRRRRISAFVAKSTLHRVDRVNFSIAVGAAVPRQADLQRLPSELADIPSGLVSRPAGDRGQKLTAHRRHHPRCRMITIHGAEQ